MGSLIGIVLIRSVRNFTTGCLEWQGARVKDREGKLTYGVVGRRKLLVHRVSWSEQKGPIPKGKYVCHKCDNVICVEKDHLFIGTPTENMQDCIKKGRRPKLRIPVKGENNGAAKLTVKQVVAIRGSEKTGKDLAIEYGVAPATISLIKNNKRWGHAE